MHDQYITISNYIRLLQKKNKNISKHFFQKNKDTVTVHTPHSSCVSVVGTKPLAIDRVPYVSYL